MSASVNGRALVFSFWLGIRIGRAEWVRAFGALAVLAALVTSYGQILNALPAAVMNRMHLTASQSIWYLVFTELTIVGTFSRFREVQDDIQDGLMEIAFLRPVEFWPLKLSGWLGEQSATLCLTVPAGIVLGLLLTKSAPDIRDLLVMLPVFYAALMIILMSYLLIGSTSLWLGEARPVFYLYQKLIFLLGGLLWPLSFYPDWLGRLAWMTPFPAMIAAPGQFALGLPRESLSFTLAIQVVWLAAFLAACHVCARLMRHRLQSKGG